MTRFYKANGKVGSTVLFWALNGRGYVTDLDREEIFTKEEAQADIDNGWLRDNDEFPLSVERVNELAEWRIDHQYVEKTYPEFTDPNDEYVFYLKGEFNGNDLYFSNLVGFCLNYSFAVWVSSEKAIYYLSRSNNHVFIPRYHADEIARRTFQVKNINRRKMISGAGLIGLRKKRERKTTGKTRTNCIICGKIVWDYIHPDMQITCDDWDCKFTHDENKERRLMY